MYQALFESHFLHRLCRRFAYSLVGLLSSLIGFLIDFGIGFGSSLVDLGFGVRLGSLDSLFGFGIYRLGRKLKINKSVCVFLATCLGDLFTYCVTSVQLGFAHPAAEGGVMASITTFMGIFAVTQIPLAIVEGLLSVVVILALESYASSELGELAYSQY